MNTVSVLQMASVGLALCMILQNEPLFHKLPAYFSVSLTSRFGLFISVLALISWHKHSLTDSDFSIHLRVCNSSMQHERLHVKHRGHEAMHAEMVLILIATLVVAQIVLVQWKQRHCRSYNVSAILYSLGLLTSLCFNIKKLMNIVSLVDGHTIADVGGSSLLYH